MNKKVMGNVGEKKAATKLAEDGYTIITQNYRSKYGEIDIIALKDDTIAFVEVKVFNSLDKGNLEYMINARKKRHIVNTAQYYLMNNEHFREKHKRFDVILFQNNFTHFQHLKNAF
jgi:putative endonuclease